MNVKLSAVIYLVFLIFFRYYLRFLNSAGVEFIEFKSIISTTQNIWISDPNHLILFV